MPGHNATTAPHGEASYRAATARERTQLLLDGRRRSSNHHPDHGVDSLVGNAVLSRRIVQDAVYDDQIFFRNHGNEVSILSQRRVSPVGGPPKQSISGERIEAVFSSQGVRSGT